MTASIVYKGNLRCECTHLQSGTVIETDAPTDNRGKGERFSPTDSLCVALATCLVTTMALKANDMGIILTFPATLQLEDKDRIILERVGNNCPVAKSLHPDLEVNIEYKW